MSTATQTALDWYEHVSNASIQTHLENIKLVDTIGDLAIYADEQLVYVRCDDKTILNIPRAGHGFDRFVEVLQTLVQ